VQLSGRLELSDADGNLDRFDERLQAAKAKIAPAPRQIATSALGQGLRYAMEILAGAIVGGGMGWWLDRWLGTRPWLALLMLLLGLGAGFVNLMRAVNRDAGAAAANEGSRSAMDDRHGAADRNSARQGKD
jgi:ATP synthase protein I